MQASFIIFAEYSPFSSRAFSNFFQLAAMLEGRTKVSREDGTLCSSSAVRLIVPVCFKKWCHNSPSELVRRYYRKGLISRLCLFVILPQLVVNASAHSV